MPAVEFDPSGLLEFTKFRLCEIEECPVIAIEGIAGESREGVAQKAFTRGRAPAFRVEFSAKPGPVLLR
jgi:hypothetical protein